MKTHQIAVIILSSILSFNVNAIINGQELSKDKTIEYIERKLLENTLEENSIPGGAKNSNVSEYSVKLEYEYLMVETHLKNNSSHIKKAKLQDSRLWIKHIPEEYFESSNIFFPEHYSVYIGNVNLPPFSFLRKTDAERVLKALDHMKKFIEKDPFDQ